MNYYHVLEDCPVQRDKVIRIVEDVIQEMNYTAIKKGVVTANANDFLEATVRYGSGDLYFMDYILDESDSAAQTGIDVSKILDARGKDIYIVLLTGYSLALAKMHEELKAPFHYIAKENLNKSEIKSVIRHFHKEDETIPLTKDDIVCVKKILDSDMIEVHYKENSFKERRSLLSFEKENKEDFFFKCNRTEIVNLNNIVKFYENERKIELINGHEILVSVRKWNYMKNLINKFEYVRT